MRTSTAVFVLVMSKGWAAMAQRNESITTDQDQSSIPEGETKLVLSLPIVSGSRSFLEIAPGSNLFLRTVSQQADNERALAGSSSNDSDETNNLSDGESIVIPIVHGVCIGAALSIVIGLIIFIFNYDCKGWWAYILHDIDIRDSSGADKVQEIIEELGWALNNYTSNDTRVNKFAFTSLVNNMRESLEKQLPPETSDQDTGRTKNPSTVFASIGLTDDESKYLHKETIDRLKKMSELSGDDEFLKQEFIDVTTGLIDIMSEIGRIVYNKGHRHTPRPFIDYFFQRISPMLDILLGGEIYNPLRPNEEKRRCRTVAEYREWERNFLNQITLPIDSPSEASTRASSGSSSGSSSDASSPPRFPESLGPTTYGRLDSNWSESAEE